MTFACKVISRFLCHCSNAVKRQYAKATLTKEIILFEAACCFRRLVHNHRGRKQSGMRLKWELRVLHPDLYEAGKEEKDTELAMVFETSKIIPCDIIPNTRSHLLILLRLFQKLETKYSNICA